MFLAKNSLLITGSILVLSVMAFAYIGPLFVDLKNAEVASAFPPEQSPNTEHWLGVDFTGRDILAWLMRTTRNSLSWALIAGSLGTVLGVGLGFFGGRVGKFVQSTVEIVSGTKTTILVLLALVMALRLVISAFPLDLTTEYRLILVVLTAASSIGAARNLRFLRSITSECSYTNNAVPSRTKSANAGLTEQPTMKIWVLLPIGALTAIATSIAGLACMEALGFGPDQYHDTLASIQYWAWWYNALARGIWWLWAPPIVVPAILFGGALAASFGLNRWVNETIEQRIKAVENNV